MTLTNSTTEPKTVPRLKDLAKILGVTTKTVERWRRDGMECGKPGEWIVADARSFADNCLKDHRNNGRMDSAFAELKRKKLEAEARQAVANAELAELNRLLARGNYTDIETLNRFMAEFLAEIRQLHQKMVVDFAAGYGPDLSPRLREDLEKRIELILVQSHDWIVRTQDLKKEKVA